MPAAVVGGCGEGGRTASVAAVVVGGVQVRAVQAVAPEAVGVRSGGGGLVRRESHELGEPAGVNGGVD